MRRRESDRVDSSLLQFQSALGRLWEQQDMLQFFTQEASVKESDVNFLIHLLAAGDRLIGDAAAAGQLNPLKENSFNS